MDTHNYVEYELCDPVSNKRHITESRDEAAGYYEREWIVVERQVVKCKPSAHTQTELIVRRAWNNNPEFEGV